MNGSEAYDIDPVAALELLPKKIEDRNRILQSLLLDLSVIKESPFGEEQEITALEKSVEAQRSYLRLYKSRLDSIQKAAQG